MAPTYVVAYNPTDAAVVADSPGRTVGGGEWAAVRRGEVLDAAGNRGSLIVVTKVDVDTAGPDAERAARQAADLNTRAEAWAGVDLEVVRDVGRANLSPTGYGDAGVDALDRVDLVDLLVRNGIEPPVASTSTTAAGDDDEGLEAAAADLAAPAPSSRSRRGGSSS